MYRCGPRSMGHRCSPWASSQLRRTFCSSEAWLPQLRESARLEWVDVELLASAEAACSSWPAAQQVEALWLFARLRWRGPDPLARSEGGQHAARSALGAAALCAADLSPQDLARLSWSLARLDCAGAAAATACRVLGPRALPRVVEFDPPDLARLASALCRLGDVEGAWQLYARAQRALPGASGSQDLRGAMLGASERCNNLTRSLSVLAHLAIFPRVSRSPTWRLSLTVVATLLVWRRMGPRAAVAARALLQEPGNRRSQMAGALEKRLDDLLVGAGSGAYASPLLAAAASAAAPPPLQAALAEVEVERRTGLGAAATAALRALATAVHSGPRDRTADRRKEFELLRHIANCAFPWAAADVLREVEVYATRRTFLKLAGGVKRRLLERAASEAPAGLVVELGTYVGYSAAVLALARGAKPLPPASDLGQVRGPGPPLVITAELDPVNGVVARCVHCLAGLAGDIEVWIGSSGDVARYVLDRFGPRSVAMLFMDHRGSIFHDDLQSFEELGLFVDGARVVADNVLKPGAPYFLWHLGGRH
ncbi:unnamed protein product [Polarella glacialis]|uniref:catechol O-methyltransferase n=1 Tax=Polarella glacialis TaxID=89957 RepID=A0A813H342_POLGL|nr:unnamed protein product [Polarella glacialis]